MMRFFAIFVLLILAGPSRAAEFEVAPSGRILTTDTVQIALSGLPPGLLVDVSAGRLSQNNRDWFGSRVRYRADADGRIDLAWSPSLGGSYTGVDGDGLFWSMVPLAKPEGLEPRPGELFLRASDATGRLLAERIIVVSQRSDAIEEIAAPFPGAFLLRPTDVPIRGALIALGGSEGGAGFARGIAPRLASRGYAVLGLPYYQSPGRPQTFENLPLEPLTEARDWLVTQAGVSPDRVGLIGVSKGAELAVLASSELPWVSLIVAYAPSDVIWEGWGSPGLVGVNASFSIGGRPYAFLAYDQLECARAAAVDGAPFDLKSTMDRARMNSAALEAATIPVERFDGAMLLIAGEDDQIWPSAEMARRIVARRLRHGLSTEIRTYSDAGHYLVGDAFAGAYASEDAGGSRPGNAFARRDAWRRVLAFLDRWPSS